MSHRRVGRPAAPGEVWDATFSDEKPAPLYRYRLRRLWEEGDRKPLVVIGLNPSTADENVLDPTVSRCVKRARRLGHRGLVMLNLFGLRSTDPAALYRTADPVGRENDRFLLKETDPAACGAVLCAWGCHAARLGREAEALRLLRKAGRTLYCLKLTKDGHPQHPLYLADALPLQPWQSDPCLTSSIL
jgi:hypothetical protein